MNTANGPLEDRQRDLYRKFVGVIAKRWWVVAITFVAVVTSAAVWLAREPRQYEARASIVIDSATPQVLGGQFRDVIDIEMGAWWSAREYIQTQYNVIKSESLAREVARRLDAAGQLSKLELGEGEAAREAAAKLILGMVQVDPVKESRIVNIAIRYTDPEAAALIANAVADAYIDQNLERRIASTRGAAMWLDGQLGDLKRKLEASELALYDFKRQNNILSVSLEDSRNILSNEIQKLSEAANEAKTKRIQI